MNVPTPDYLDLGPWLECELTVLVDGYSIVDDVGEVGIGCQTGSACQGACQTNPIFAVVYPRIAVVSAEGPINKR